jgi:hypothetical protein
MKFEIGHPKDFWGGVLFAVIGLSFAMIAKGLKLGDTVLIPGYAMGVPARMGPAFFPFWLGLLLFVLGVAIAITGFKHEGKEEDRHFPVFHWKPILFVLGAVLLFGLILKHVGMLIAGILLVVLSGYGSAEFSLKRSVILAVVLVIFCALVFVVGLKLPIPLCPDVEAIQSSLPFCRL